MVWTPPTRKSRWYEVWSEEDPPDGIKVPKVRDTISHRQPEGPEMKLNVVGMDVAKRVFQVHWVQADTGEIVSVQTQVIKDCVRLAGALDYQAR
jgi:hypothetical protein